MTAPPVPGDDDETSVARRTYFGRNGSPEITVAFPFSKVEVSRSDEEARAGALAALDAVASLIQIVEALAAASTADERRNVGRDLQQLRTDLGEIVSAMTVRGDDPT